METEKFMFYLVAFDQIKLYTRLALKFCKRYICSLRKMTRNGHKMAKLKGYNTHFSPNNFQKNPNNIFKRKFRVRIVSERLHEVL